MLNKLLDGFESYSKPFPFPDSNECLLLLGWYYREIFGSIIRNIPKWPLGCELHRSRQNQSWVFDLKVLEEFLELGHE